MKTLGATILLALIPLQASATISRAMSFDDKVDHASAIVLGKCIATTSRWDPTGKWILTYSTFQVEQSMKGQPAQQITLVTPGGVVDGVHQETIGVPTFETGDDHVVFIKNTNVGPTVLYFEQGAYDVERVRGERVVRPMASAAVLVDTQRGAAVAPEEARTVREFGDAVRNRVRHREAIERMNVLKRQQKEQASLINILRRNRMLVLLALIGAMVATWQLVKRW